MTTELSASEEVIFRGRLLALADRYAEHARRTGAASALRYASGGQIRLYDNLSAGGTTTFRMYDRCVQWFSDNWSENAEWPADIRRPQPVIQENADGE